MENKLSGLPAHVAMFVDTRSNVVSWFHQRHLVNADLIRPQILKLGEEIGELAEAYQLGQVDSIAVEAGDCCVVLTGLCEQMEGMTSEGLLPPTPIVHYGANPMKNVSSQRLFMASMLDIQVSYSRIVEFELKGKGVAHIEIVQDAMECMVKALGKAVGAMGCDLSVGYQAAYKKIELRQGKKVNGVFIKEEDL